MTASALRRLRVQLQAAEAKVTATSERRRLLPVGSSRARVTTANARYATACEARDRALAAVEEAEAVDAAARDFWSLVADAEASTDARKEVVR